MRPTQAGRYWAREIIMGLGGTRLNTLWERVEVVAGVPNERNHKLLVPTGLQRPKYRSLDCYEWGGPVAETEGGKLPVVAHSV